MQNGAAMQVIHFQHIAQRTHGQGGRLTVAVGIGQAAVYKIALTQGAGQSSCDGASPGGEQASQPIQQMPACTHQVAR